MHKSLLDVPGLYAPFHFLNFCGRGSFPETLVRAVETGFLDPWCTNCWEETLLEVVYKNQTDDSPFVTKWTPVKEKPTLVERILTCMKDFKGFEKLEPRLRHGGMSFLCELISEHRNNVERWSPCRRAWVQAVVTFARTK